MAEADDNDAAAPVGGSVEGSEGEQGVVSSDQPQFTEEQQEFQRALIGQIAGEAKQLLTLVGFAVEDSGLLQAAAIQLEAQAVLSQQVTPMLTGMPRAQFPILFAQFTRPGASLITVPGQPTAQPFVVGGPKQLDQDSDIASVASAVAALAYLTNPALRAVCMILGVMIGFGQTKPQAPPQKRIIV